MKIGLLSDLHIDSNNRRLEKNYLYAPMLASLIEQRQIELMLIAGDISSDYRLSQDFLKALQDEAGIPVYFVPGNHEFWQKTESSQRAEDIFEFFLQQEENLVGQPRIIKEGWALVGSPSWYDYGYGDHDKFSIEEFERGKYRYAKWNDKKYVNWGQSDQEVSQWMKDLLEEDLKCVQNYNIIMMTHVATHPRFVVPLPHKLYDYMNAYLGARSYESLYHDFPVRYNIMGHVHWNQNIYSKGVHHLMACLGNRKQWLNKTDPLAEMENRLLSFQIN